MTRPQLRRVLAVTWWGIFPVFGILVARFCADRMCGDPFDLLPSLARSTTAAWPIAGIYVAAHVWVVAAYLVTLRDRLLPSVADIRQAWSNRSFCLWTMVCVFAIEYAPSTLWRALGALTECRR